jgi:hypothetical protein
MIEDQRQLEKGLGFARSNHTSQGGALPPPERPEKRPDLEVDMIIYPFPSRHPS